ncbi:NAD-dependent epimerase/dehydratase family protein [Aliifodinibius sp. S!AR15-10]|uniref:NAD-dependent epimerase/dehydratase family protein n=1 Tax=Aliifodinibius sp. S!AR15-10 TaxID=2950437 RepID=UPI0028580CF8|nr:NAD-dependent epimerase/dehydratase family protein [Aliifodinibius sp. S!AR15-10]MDR8391650.1 NAD-dependent epimerase/dehydratase family protein [Aliifodinibius sp. S!AR15-10]
MANVLITGATGMVGKGVLLECIQHPQIESITLISRSPVDIESPKIKQVLLEDFMEMGTVKDQLGHIDGCFHCMGVSSVGISEEKYTKLTFKVTKKLADMCFELNPDMTFIYVSGLGTDSTEEGKQMWARVKGKTENYILGKGFKRPTCFDRD